MIKWALKARGTRFCCERSTSLVNAAVSVSSSVPDRHSFAHSSIVFLLSPRLGLLGTATMLGLQELDDVICQQLRKSDLVKCIQVNKQWYSIVVPHLWGAVYLTPSWNNVNSRQSQAFCKMVLEDYLDGQEHRQLQSGEEYGQTSSFLLLSTLTRCGPYIREMMHPRTILECFDTHITSLRPWAGRGEAPTSMELLYHLYQRCPAVEVPDITLNYRHPNVDDSWTRLMESLIPRTRQLDICISYRDPNPELTELKTLLNRCSSVLTKLTLDIEIVYTEDGESERTPKQVESIPEEGVTTEWTSLREVFLRCCSDNSVSSPIWSWLWKRFGRVEKLVVRDIHDISRSLAEGMSNHMPNLRKIALESRDFTHTKLTDTEIAGLFQSCKGLEDVALHIKAPFGRPAVEALLKHIPTLKTLRLMPCYDPSSNDLVQILASSPNLHALVDINVLSHRGGRYPRIKANAFIDRDPSTGSLRPWKCEDSLKVLEIKVIGIPRPDIAVETEREAYPGQGRDIQSQVYDRLARLTNLERLWLGDKVYGEYFEDDPPTDPMPYQIDCLELSLESGLHKLSGLKAMQALNVSGMRSKIGVKEVHWMAEHWPKLRIIYGIDDNEAVRWLRKHCPDIAPLRYYNGPV